MCLCRLQLRQQQPVGALRVAAHPQHPQRPAQPHSQAAFLKRSTEQVRLGGPDSPTLTIASRQLLLFTPVNCVKFYRGSGRSLSEPTDLQTGPWPFITAGTQHSATCLPTKAFCLRRIENLRAKRLSDCDLGVGSSFGGGPTIEYRFSPVSIISGQVFTMAAPPSAPSRMCRAIPRPAENKPGVASR